MARFIVEQNFAMEEKIIVIGSGIGGIASAIRLAADGNNVTVFEQASQPGGKLNQIKQDGFRFDTGPSLFTLPLLVDQLFEVAGRKREDYFQYEKLNNVCKYHFSDGNILNAWSDPAKFAKEAAIVFKEPERNILKYLDRVGEMYNMSAGLFIFRPFARLNTLLSAEGKKVAFQLHKLDMILSMHQRNKKSFDNGYLVQLFNRYGTYNGSNPYKAPATLNMIAHLEHNEGAYFPKQGMYVIVESLVKLARDIGVKFQFNSHVDSIEFERKRVKGVKVNGEFIACNRIVSDMDVSALYKGLMPKKQIPWRVRLMEKSSSALIFYWGINREFKQLELHNIFFADNYKEEFDYLFRLKELYFDPTIYVFISNKHTGSDAPKGMENWFVMINAPVDKGQYTGKTIQKIKKNIIKKLNKALKIDLSQNIVSEAIGTPVTIAESTSSVGGAIYGSSSNSRFSAFLRHPNRSRKYRGLHFAGGSVHPGGGIPLCIASANIVANDIQNEKRN